MLLRKKKSNSPLEDYLFASNVSLMPGKPYILKGRLVLISKYKETSDKDCTLTGQWLDVDFVPNIGETLSFELYGYEYEALLCWGGHIYNGEILFTLKRLGFGSPVFNTQKENVLLLKNWNYLNEDVDPEAYVLAKFPRGDGKKEAEATLLVRMAEK